MLFKASPGKYCNGSTAGRSQRNYPGHFSLAMVVVQSLTNSFGEMVIAANVIIMRVDGFAMMPNFSFGTAMTTYSGQNVGAKSWIG